MLYHYKYQFNELCHSQQLYNNIVTFLRVLKLRCVLDKGNKNQFRNQEEHDLYMTPLCTKVLACYATVNNSYMGSEQTKL